LWLPLTAETCRCLKLATTKSFVLTDCVIIAYYTDTTGMRRFYVKLFVFLLSTFEFRSYISVYAIVFFLLNGLLARHVFIVWILYNSCNLKSCT